MVRASVAKVAGVMVQLKRKVCTEGTLPTVEAVTQDDCAKLQEEVLRLAGENVQLKEDKNKLKEENDLLKVENELLKKQLQRQVMNYSHKQNSKRTIANCKS